MWSALISASASLGGALGGAFFGSWLSDRRERRNRKLNDFYNPLWALQANTQIYHDLLSRMNSAAQRVEESRTSGKASTTGGLPEQMMLKDDDFAELTKNLMPLYRNMIHVFRTNMPAADQMAYQYYPILCHYVRSWERSVRNAAPAQEWIVAGESTKVLEPFYMHLKSTRDKLLSSYI
jgi:hypothetical protein